MKHKKMIWTAAIALLLPAMSFGQTKIEKVKRTIVETHSDTILIKKGDRDLRVKIYEEFKEGDKVRSEKIYSGVYVDYEHGGDNAFVDDLPFLPNKTKSKKKGFDANYPFFYFSFGRGTSGALSYSSRYPERTGKSVDWGFNVYNSELELDKQLHWGLTWALGFAYTRHVFDSNIALEKIDDNIVCQPAPDGIEYRKSFLRYWSFRIPICIEWQKKIKKAQLYFSAGPEVEIRFAMKSKAKYEGQVHTLTGNPNSNVLGTNLMVQAGYGCLSFIGRFGLTPLMDKSRAPHLYHSSIGFGVHF